MVLLTDLVETTLLLLLYCVRSSVVAGTACIYICPSLQFDH